VYLVGEWLQLDHDNWLVATMALSAIVAVIVSLSLNRNLRYSKLRGTDKYRPDIDLPTVSVCIPARNETEDLPACLRSILESNYPKLEILVLDDCSQDKTSEIIKGLAHSGVRFIKGEPPRQKWLAKNQAYQQLAEAASGQVLLFCGVDVRMGKKTIWSLIDCLHSRNKKMISVLPKGEQTGEHASIVQPMRYWWELAWPRRLFNRPPTLSSCWIIDSKTLKALGNFQSVSNKVIPEAYFARELIKQDAYSFLRSDKKLEVSSNKKFTEQRDTAVRTRYPELRKRPESVLLVMLAEMMLLLFPIVFFMVGFFRPVSGLWIASGIITILLALAHYRIIKVWDINNLAVPVALLPIAIAYELYILHLSMYRYELSEVAWKERNICIPVMQSIPRLPRLP
ncbi:MAG: glycosyltransferase, partial [bacterium]|nr:glycosyltransferase [bacterium]